MLPDRLQVFIEPIMSMCRSQFPRDCYTCKRHFADFRDFVVGTGPVGALLPFSGKSDDPFGVISYVNCQCGSTLVLQCEDMTGPRHLQFMQALEEESKAAGRSVKDLLLDIRAEIRQRVMKEVGR